MSQNTTLAIFKIFDINTGWLLRTGFATEGSLVEYDPKKEWVEVKFPSGRTNVITRYGTMTMIDDFGKPVPQRRDFYIKDDVGIKYDDNKNRLDLIPVEALEQVGEIYSYGTKKYADHNWRKGIKFSRLYGASLRHLFAFWRGEDKDKESGLPHLAHAVFGLLGILQYTTEGRRDLDDRFIWSKERIKSCGDQETKEPARTVGDTGTTPDLVAKCNLGNNKPGFAVIV